MHHKRTKRHYKTFLMKAEFKLSILYTVWTGDDMEMLQRSIEQHEPFVDGITICFQEISNKGEYSNQNLPPIFGNNKLNYMPFHPNLDKSTKENERIKHDLMIQEAKKHGFTHFILSACDHFYSKETFDYCKNWVKENDPDVILTKMITYYKQENWCVFPLENYYMPFIHKMHPNTEISATAKYPRTVDPSVKVNTFAQWVVMDPSEAILHHYSMIRPDIQKKFRNAASSIRWSENQVKTFISEYENAKLGDKIVYFKGAELVDVSEVLDWVYEAH